MSRWTMRCARMLAGALIQQRQEVAAARASAAIDGGLGELAVAAIAALPKGPRRDLEIALWVRRIGKHVERIATVIRPDMTEAQFEAQIDLHTAIALANGAQS